jgi:hypothetical protein
VSAVFKLDVGSPIGYAQALNSHAAKLPFQQVFSSPVVLGRVAVNEIQAAIDEFDGAAVHPPFVR